MTLSGRKKHVELSQVMQRGESMQSIINQLINEQRAVVEKEFYPILVKVFGVDKLKVSAYGDGLLIEREKSLYEKYEII